MSHARLEVAAPGCVAEEFDAEIVALNMTTGRYFSIRGLGLAVWQDLVAGHPPAAVGAALAARGTPEEASSRFIGDLVEHGLMRPANGNAAGALPPLASAAAGGTLQIDAYDDMVALIGADPVHEVDEEAGWPAVRQPETARRA